MTTLTLTPKPNQVVLRTVLDLMDGSSPHTIPLHPEMTVVGVQPHRKGVEFYALCPAEALQGTGLVPRQVLTVETGVEVLPPSTYLGSAMLPGTKAMHVFLLDAVLTA